MVWKTKGCHAKALRPANLLITVTMLLAAGSCALVGSGSIIQVPVTAGQARSALDAALTRVDYPYEWAGNGPDKFDCSGLIVWAYQSALKDSYIFSDGNSVVCDVTMDTLYNHNIKRIEAAQALPGDLVFITYDPDRITHGGLVQAIYPDKVEFINASSHYLKVLVDEWPLNDTVRGQWIAGFGRFLASSR